ncbi:MAG: PPE domain-containing protein [Stackebrandtia sp.]
MGRIEGDGADNLNYTSWPYPTLRAAVYAIGDEGIRVAQNEWADLKRRLNDRIGTLHVAIAKLRPDWDSPAGRQALDALAAHRDWMSELASIAERNEIRMDAVAHARRKAVEAMRKLDAQPGGPQPPGQAGTPAPSPAPAATPPGTGEPVEADWRQPPAAKIASYVYSEIALAAATMSIPDRSQGDVGSPEPLPGTGSGTGPPPSPSPNPTPTTSTVSPDADRDSTPAGSKTPTGTPGTVITGSAHRTAPHGIGTKASGPRANATAGPGAVRDPAKVLGGANARTPGAGAANPPAGKSPTADRPGAAPPGPGGTPGQQHPTPSPREGAPSGPPRGSDAVPPPAAGQPPPPATPSAGSGYQHRRRVKRRKAVHELTEPETFAPLRAAGPPGGLIEPTHRVVNTNPGPGVIGTNKSEAVEPAEQPWDVPDPQRVNAAELVDAPAEHTVDNDDTRVTVTREVRGGR